MGSMVELKGEGLVETGDADGASEFNIESHYNGVALCGRKPCGYAPRQHYAERKPSFSAVRVTKARSERTKTSEMERYATGGIEVSKQRWSLGRTTRYDVVT